MDLTCPHCGIVNPAHSAFCGSCGKALPLPEESGPREVTGKGIPQTLLATRRVADDLQKQMKKAAGALLAVAIIQAVFGGLMIFLFANQGNGIPPILPISVFGVAAIFLGLFFWAPEESASAAIAGLILYISLFALDAVADPRTLGNGWLIKIVIVGTLVSAIGAGQKHRQLSRSLSREA